MVERRDVIGGGLAAGLSALLGARSAEAVQRDAAASDDDAATAKAIDALQRMLERRHESADVDQIRTQQKAFLKSNQKFPDFIDIGIDVWERLHDWHIKTGQPFVIVRTNDGHYAIPFVGSTLVLQPQQAGSYVSWGYDVR